jgi:hypothetical protein
MHSHVPERLGPPGREVPVVLADLAVPVPDHQSGGERMADGRREACHQPCSEAEVAPVGKACRRLNYSAIGPS